MNLSRKILYLYLAVFVFASFIGLASAQEISPTSANVCQAISYDLTAYPDVVLIFSVSENSRVEYGGWVGGETGFLCDGQGFGYPQYVEPIGQVYLEYLPVGDYALVGCSDPAFETYTTYTEAESCLDADILPFSIVPYTPSATTTTTLINNPNQDLFNGLVLFFGVFGFLVWFFKRPYDNQ